MFDGSVRTICASNLVLWPQINNIPFKLFHISFLRKPIALRLFSTHITSLTGRTSLPLNDIEHPLLPGIKKALAEKIVWLKPKRKQNLSITALKDGATEVTLSGGPLSYRKLPCPSGRGSIITVKRL